MPELPEVETIARTLAPQVEGRRIVACELLNPSTFEGTIPLGKVVGGVIGLCVGLAIGIPKAVSIVRLARRLAASVGE